MKVDDQELGGRQRPDNVVEFCLSAMVQNVPGS